MNNTPSLEVEFKTVIDHNENIYSIGDDFALANIPVKDINFGHSPSRMSGLVLILCTNGKAHININMKPHLVVKNDFVILPPGQITQVIDGNADFSMYALYMSEAFLTDNVSMNRSRNMTIFFTIRDNPIVHMEENDINIITLYFDLMVHRIKDRSNPHLLTTMRHIFNALMSDMNDAFLKYLSVQKNKISRKDDICQNFMKLLMSHYKECRDVKFYADKLYITPKYLSNTLKAVTGKKAGQMIDEYVVLQAKILLSSTNMTIQQISEELNFANQSFFGRYFKRITGLSPTQYRR
jgi:AraC-like DNA-binding protein